MNKKAIKNSKIKKVFGKSKKESPIIYYQPKNKINYKIKNILFLLYFREDAIIKELIKIIIKKKKWQIKYEILQIKK